MRTPNIEIVDEIITPLNEKQIAFCQKLEKAVRDNDQSLYADLIHGGAMAAFALPALSQDYHTSVAVNRRNFIKMMALVTAATGVQCVVPSRSSAFFGLLCAFVAGVIAVGAAVALAGTSFAAGVTAASYSGSRPRFRSFKKAVYTATSDDGAVSWEREEGGNIYTPLYNYSNKKKEGIIVPELLDRDNPEAVEVRQRLAVELPPYYDKTLKLRYKNLPQTGDKVAAVTSEINKEQTKHPVVVS